jgi:hypothetical protein
MKLRIQNKIYFNFSFLREKEKIVDDKLKKKFYDFKYSFFLNLILIKFIKKSKICYLEWYLHMLSTFFLRRRNDVFWKLIKKTKIIFHNIEKESYLFKE